jgi:hypothetical protein
MWEQTIFIRYHPHRKKRVVAQRSYTDFKMPRKRRKNASLGTRKKGTKQGNFIYGGAAESNAAILEKEREEIEILQRIEIDKQYRLAVTEDESNEKRNVDYRLRIAIFYIYVDVLGAPDRCAWKDTDGTIHRIRRALFLPEGKRNVVARVLDQAHTLAAMGSIYNGERQRPREFSKFLIAPASEDMQIIADAMESGFGLRLTKELLNEHRQQKNLPTVGLTTVWMAYLRLKPVITPIRKRKQGSNDPASPWAIARLEYVTQILVRFGGLLTTEEVAGLAPPGELIPDKFNVLKLTKVSINQIAFWDETHKKVRVGQVGANGMKYQVRFRRDDDGKVNADNGSCIAEEGSQLKMKYAEEVRLCLGVVKVKLDDGTEEGKRLPVFDYSGKVILTIKDYERKVAEEIQRVSNLQGNGGGWIECNREKGKFWESENLTAVKGIGKKTADNLARKGILSIGALKGCNNQQLSGLVGLRMSLKQLKKMQLLVLEALPGEPPADALTINHKKNPLEVNPYKSRYGPSWMDELKKSIFMSKHVCIKDLVWHIYEHTKACFENTEYSDNFYFYHDALSLMTATETTDWMEEKDILKHWFLPELDLNKGTCYAGRPVGNSPELMPLDASLNKDVDDAAHRHIVFTHCLEDDNPQKFTMSTPHKGSRAYQRVWNSPAVPAFETGEIVEGGAPSSTRIIQDIDKFLLSAHTIFRHKGIVVDGLGTRHGHRNEIGISQKRGGARKKGVDLPDDSFIHPDARSARMDALSNSIRTHRSVGECDVDSIIEDNDLLDELDDDFDARSCESILEDEVENDNRETNLEEEDDEEDENPLKQTRGKPNPVYDECSSSEEDEDENQTSDK